jgi:pimeloyl-ACP methyl ester carboxylesterase
MTGAERARDLVAIGEGAEFGLLAENAAELGLPWTGPFTVQRVPVEVGGREVSSPLSGDAPARVVFRHGSGQNARTWDSVVPALGEPALAIDLPGHGHSAWHADREAHALPCSGGRRALVQHHT